MSRVWAWACLFLGLSVGAFSSLVGISPRVVERLDGGGNPIDCGPTLFHSGARPSPLCDSLTDPWRIAAEVGLFVAALLIIPALGFLLRTAISQHATDSRT